MAKLASRGNEKTKKEIEAVSEKIQASKLKVKDIIIPISVGIILIILGVFVFVPMIKTAMSFRAEYQEIKDKEEKLVQLENDIRTLDEGIFQVDLLNAREVIPKTLRVSSFMYYIDTLANDLSLESKSLSAGDTQIVITQKGDSKDKNSYLGVSSPLSYTGSLENILEFLDTLYSASPYIISTDNVSLREFGTDWRVTLNITGYYVPEQELANINLYAPFVKYTQYQDVVDIFENKADKLD